MSGEAAVSRRTTRYRIAFAVGALAGSAVAGYLWWYFGDTGPEAQNPDRGEALGILFLLLALPTSLATGLLADLLPQDRFGSVLMTTLLVGGVPLNWGLACLAIVALVSPRNREMDRQDST